MKKGQSSILLHEYFKQWIFLYKKGAVRDVTMRKYLMTLKHLQHLAPKTKLLALDRKEYQKILNDFAETHERQTTMDFHHQLKGAILDAIDDGLLNRDPTRKVVIKGKEASSKKKRNILINVNYKKLIARLELNEEINFDWLIMLIAKTGLRFSESLAITPEDFDFSNQILNISKTWNYKSPIGGFQPTKNKSSIRKIQMDWRTAMQFATLIKNLPQNEPIFVRGRIFNSTINDKLESYCADVSIPIISVHGLRHTHASLLLYAGVSIASVARRLGHANITTTQHTYLHIIQELENKDNNKIINYLSGLY